MIIEKIPTNQIVYLSQKFCYIMIMMENHSLIMYKSSSFLDMFR